MSTAKEPLSHPAARPAAGDRQPSTPLEILRFHAGDLWRVLAANAAIGVPVALVTGIDQLKSQIYSQCIGLSIFALAVAVSRWLGSPRAEARAMLVAVPAGCLNGLLLGGWLTGDRLLSRAQEHIGILVAPLTLSTLIGAGIGYVFYSRGLLAEKNARIQEAELKRELERQRAGMAQLKALQAQIEPHFLFNTLSNVISMIDERPQAAKDMLVDLSRLLRGSLVRARSDTLPLFEEIAGIRAYLDIQAQRLGGRLRYEIEVDPQLESLPIAPYLLQPLVENAIRHGLEPLVEGGRVQVRVRRHGQEVRAEVADTGRGLRANHEPGVALANIRERLQALYGERATLSLHPNSPRGVVARVTFPVEVALTPGPSPARGAGEGRSRGGAKS